MQEDIASLSNVMLRLVPLPPPVTPQQLSKEQLPQLPAAPLVPPRAQPGPAFARQGFTASSLCLVDGFVDTEEMVLLSGLQGLPLTVSPLMTVTPTLSDVQV